MPVYKSPIRPYDPVIPQEGTRNFYYLRDSFYGEGQDSFTQPFSQNQEMFSKMQNIMPMATGVCQLRYGYQLFNNPNIGAVKNIYSYQNLLAGTRSLVYVSGTAIDVSAEDGTGLSSILTSNTTNPRIANSRDYAFIPGAVAPITWPSGQQSDGQKWHSVQGLSNWGIASPPGTLAITSTATAGNITLISTVGRVYSGAYRNSISGHYSDANIVAGSFTQTTVGPNLPGTAATVGTEVWNNPNNIKLIDGTLATSIMSCSPGTDDATGDITASNFGFSIPGSSTIVGVQVTINRNSNISAPQSHTKDILIQLTNSGVIGDNKAALTVNWPGVLGVASYGGASDNWNASLTPTIVNSAGFGVVIAAIGTTTNINGGSPVTVTAGIDYVQVTVYYQSGGSVNTGTITAKQVNLTLPTSNPPAGVDQFVILATLDGGDTTNFFILDTVPIATTTYIDNTPDTVLVTNNVASEIDDFGTIHGLDENDLPPVGLQFPIKYRGRIFGAIQDTLYFSKNLDEITTSTGLVLGRFEEAWPGLNTIPISTQRESIRGLQTDGDVLYIGTERHVWRLSGDSPSNFNKPEVVFNEVGILNQDVWQITFAQGAPVGMIWMTPDRRVIMSNFGNYQDVGTPIQDVLNTMNPAAVTSAWGGFFSEGAYDIYILAIPTGSNTVPDTFCVYDLRGQRWLTWKPADSFTTGYFNINASGIPQWLMAASTGKVYQFTSTVTQDRVNDTPVTIIPVIQTPWMHLGEPTKVKALNEIEVTTGDTGMTVSVDGASIYSQTLAPNTVTSNSSLTLSPRGFLKLYLAQNVSKDKFYRFTFTGTGTSQNVLEGYIIEAVPILY